jgi:hypothetical protein
MEKNDWSEPELTVLVRAKPEEMVLEGCKRYSTKEDGPYAFDFWCTHQLACISCLSGTAS